MIDSDTNTIEQQAAPPLDKGTPHVFDIPEPQPFEPGAPDPNYQNPYDKVSAEAQAEAQKSIPLSGLFKEEEARLLDEMCSLTFGNDGHTRYLDCLQDFMGSDGAHLQGRPMVDVIKAFEDSPNYKSVGLEGALLTKMINREKEVVSLKQAAAAFQPADEVERAGEAIKHAAAGGASLVNAATGLMGGVANIAKASLRGVAEGAKFVASPAIERSRKARGDNLLRQQEVQSDALAQAVKNVERHKNDLMALPKDASAPHVREKVDALEAAVKDVGVQVKLKMQQGVTNLQDDKLTPQQRMGLDTEQELTAKGEAAMQATAEHLEAAKAAAALGGQPEQERRVKKMAEDAAEMIKKIIELFARMFRIGSDAKEAKASATASAGAARP